jgi:hypothetical protein
MSLITQAGITPRELDDLVDAERWGSWCRVRPELEAFDSLAAIRSLRGADEDRVLGALLWLGAVDGGDDQLAAVAVLHQLGASITIIAGHFWHAADADANGIVAGAIWEQIRAFGWRERTARHAQAIHHATRKAVRCVLLRDPSRWQTRGVILPNPLSWLFEAVMERQVAGGTPTDRPQAAGSGSGPPPGGHCGAASSAPTRWHCSTNSSPRTGPIRVSAGGCAVRAWSGRSKGRRRPVVSAPGQWSCPRSGDREAAPGRSDLLGRGGMISVRSTRACA